MSGLAFPWDIPFDLQMEHNNNGETGLSPKGEKLYDEWQESLRQPLITPKKAPPAKKC